MASTFFQKITNIINVSIGDLSVQFNLYDIIRKTVAVFFVSQAIIAKPLLHTFLISCCLKIHGKPVLLMKDN